VYFSAYSDITLLQTAWKYNDQATQIWDFGDTIKHRKQYFSYFFFLSVCVHVKRSPAVNMLSQLYT